MRNAVGVLFGAIAMLTIAYAQSGPITFRSEIYLVEEEVGPNGEIQEVLTPTTEADDGALLEYRIFATNSGQTTLPAGVVQIVGPIEYNLEYVEGSATPSSDRLLTEFSIDSSSFSAPPLLTGSTTNRRVAAPSEYRMIRWTLLYPLEPSAEAAFTFRARLLGGASGGPSQAPGGTQQTSGQGSFRILSASYRWEGDYLYVVGELQNVGGVAMGVELQAIARDASGRLVDTVNFWPASISNIAPGAHYGFRYPVTRQRSAIRVDVQIVSTNKW